MYQVKIRDDVARYDENGERDQEEINLEKSIVLSNTATDIGLKADAYIAAQEYQNEHGGPGPCAEFEIMKIVNEHAGQFEVVFEDGNGDD